MINRWVNLGFLLVFHTLYSSNCSRLRVIIDFQPSKVKPGVEISLCDAIHGNKYIGTIGRYRFLLVFYTRVALAVHDF
jgi:hypothetical protein